jgi:hypothetical protein
MSHSQIATGGTNSIGPPRQIIQTYNNHPSGGRALAELAGGWKGGSVLWPEKIDENSTFGGGWPLPNCVQRAEFDQCARSKYSNIPQSTIGWLGFGRMGRGMERRLCFVAVII